MPQEGKKGFCNIFLIGMVLLASAGVINCIRYNWHGIGASDFQWLWKEYAMSVQEMTRGLGRNISEIESLPYRTATIPWGRLLGQLVIPGWLPMNSALVYTAILYVACFLVAVYLAVKVAYREQKITKNVWYVFLIFCMPFYWADAAQFMNTGVAVSLLMIIVVFIQENNEYLAGLLMALAMIKPQSALIFYLIFLLQKKYKIILSSACICLISLLIYSWFGKLNPIMQLINVGNGMDETYAFEYWLWYGFCDPLRDVGFTNNMTMLVSMLLGLLWVVGLLYVVQKSRYKNNSLFLYSIAAMGSIIWCYKSTSDIIIVILPSLLVLYAIDRYGFNMKNVLLCLGYLGCLNVKIFSSFFRVIFSYQMRWGLDMDAWIKMIAFTVFIIIMCKHESENYTI